MTRRAPSNGLIRAILWLFNKSTQFENATLAWLAESMRASSLPTGVPSFLEYAPRRDIPNDTKQAELAITALHRGCGICHVHVYQAVHLGRGFQWRPQSCLQLKIPFGKIHTYRQTVCSSVHPAWSFRVVLPKSLRTTTRQTDQPEGRVLQPPLRIVRISGQTTVHRLPQQIRQRELLVQATTKCVSPLKPVSSDNAPRKTTKEWLFVGAHQKESEVF